MSKSSLKVSDLVSFSKQDYELAKVVIRELELLIKGGTKRVGEESVVVTGYYQMQGSQNPTELEDLKIKFLSHMSTLTDIYAKVKAFKGNDHVYLSDARKEFKAEALKLLLRDPKESVKITEAKEIVYASEYYKDRIHLTEQIRKFFIEVDEKYEFFSTVLSLLQQTISVVSKDYEFNRYSKN